LCTASSAQDIKSIWESHRKLAIQHELSGDLTEAQKWYSKALDLASQRSDLKQELLESLRDLAEFHQQRGDLDQALAYYRRCLNLLAGLRTGRQSQDPILERLTEIALATQRYDQAQESLEELLSIRQAVLPGFAEEVLTVKGQLLACLVSRGEPAAAERICRQLAGSYPQETRARMQYLKHLKGIGQMLLREGNCQWAARIFKIQLRLSDETFPSDRARRMRILKNLMIAYLGEGNTSQVEMVAAQLAKICRAQRRSAPAEIAECQSLASQLLLRQGSWGKAEPILKSELDLRARMSSQPDIYSAIAWHGLGTCAAQTGRIELAQRRFEQSLRIREELLGPEDPDLGPTLSDLAGVRFASGNYASAAETYRHHLSIRQKRLGPTDPSLLDSLDGLARCYKATGKLKLEESMLKRAASIRGSRLPVKPPASLRQGQ